MGGFAIKLGLLRISQVSSIDRTSQYRRSAPPDSESGGGPPSPVPSAPVPRGPPPRQKRRVTLAAVLVTMSLVLLLIAVFTGWWSFTVIQGGATTITTSFAPGSQYLRTCASSMPGPNCVGPSGLIGYGSGDLGAVGNLYQAVQVLVILSIVLGLFAAMVAWSGVLGLGIGRRRFLIGCFAFFLSFGLALGSVVAVAAFQPSALQQDGGGIPAAAPSPLSSFWGACSTSGTATQGVCQSGTGSSFSAAWGPTLGWFCAAAASILLLIGFVELVRAGPLRRNVP